MKINLNIVDMKMEGILVLLLGILLRWTVSLYPYSGYGNPPMYGDYEAQRHWQELTVNLPIQQWYVNGSNNNLLYWGLDYPPLTSYHSYLCGIVANWLNPKYVTLHESRGFESYEHKLFMRCSILIADVLVYFPAVFFISQCREGKESKIAILAPLILYPGLILIDYGHFQYNNISLGLFLFAVGCLLKKADCFSAMFFSLALNYKQMELYHALPIFFYLLGKCLQLKSFYHSIVKIVKIGVVVIFTFIVCWLPFLESVKSAQAVLLRVFPVNRGLYEGKVANFWCTFSVLIKFKSILDTSSMAVLCLVTTAIFSLPSCLQLFFNPTFRSLKYSLFNVSLTFFMFSYHVHEKSILLSAIPACLLFCEDPFAVTWFLLVSVLSMFPLLARDGLASPTLLLAVVFLLLYRFYLMFGRAQKKGNGSNLEAIFRLSVLSIIILNISSMLISPPSRYPDIFPVLISAYCFAHFVLFLSYFYYCQFNSSSVIIMEKKTK